MTVEVYRGLVIEPWLENETHQVKFVFGPCSDNLFGEKGERPYTEGTFRPDDEPPVYFTSLTGIICQTN